MTTNNKYFYQIIDNSLILSWEVLVIILIASIKYLDDLDQFYNFQFY
jgi:hypothetical protein